MKAKGFLLKALLQRLFCHNKTNIVVFGIMTAFAPKECYLNSVVLTQKFYYSRNARLTSKWHCSLHQNVLVLTGLILEHGCNYREGSGDESSERLGESRGAKKPRLVWTAELHARFMNAVNHLVRHATAIPDVTASFVPMKIAHTSNCLCSGSPVQSEHSSGFSIALSLQTFLIDYHT